MMDSEIWQREEVDSPCVKICVIHRKYDLCIGCFRSTDEIARWSVMTDDERTRVKSELAGREVRIKPVRRGGRKRRDKPPAL